MKIFFLFISLFFYLIGTISAQTLHQKTWHFKAMGSAFSITVAHTDSSHINDCLNKAKGEIFRIERLISSWDAQSQTSQINQNAGIQPIKVDQELFQLIKRSLTIAELTNGAFDISYASTNNIWTFDGRQIHSIDSNQIRQSISNVDYKNIKLDATQQTIFLIKKGMKIGFGGIGKGYAADKTKQLLLNLGIENGVVNAGGDLIAWGKKPDNTDWTAGIADPNQKRKLLGTLPVQNTSVVTSGDYEKYILINGQRYAHIVNPQTGFPTSGIKSVTIVCPIAEMGDALATSIFVLGIEKGLSLINQLKGIECLIIDNNNRLLTSTGLKFQRNDEE